MVVPALCRSQLAEFEGRYIIGAGPAARYAFSKLRPQVRQHVTFVDTSWAKSLDGRPIIDFRKFCAVARAAEPVLFAADDRSLMSALAAAGQQNILDVEELWASERRLRGYAGIPERRSAVLSTIPRSGTYRLRYFLYALNEILGSKQQVPSAHQLYAYQLSNWSDPNSRYHLGRVLAFLGLEGLSIGHHVPPGSLAELGENPRISQLYLQRSRAFITLCKHHPALRATSFPMRPLHFEPQSSAHHCTFVLLKRDIVEQLTSMLTIYESAFSRFKALGGTHWPLDEFIARCYGHFRPFVFFLLGGRIPLFMHRAAQHGRALVEVILEEDGLRSMIGDYALQSFAAQYYAEHPAARLRASLLSYQDMLHDDVTFFRQLCELLRGGALTVDECAQVDRACHLTSRTAVGSLERELRHSLSYHDGIADVFTADSHMTGHVDGSAPAAAERSTVQAAIAGRALEIRSLLQQLLTEVRTAAYGPRVAATQDAFS